MGNRDAESPTCPGCVPAHPEGETRPRRDPDDPEKMDLEMKEHVHVCMDGRTDGDKNLTNAKMNRSFSFSTFLTSMSVVILWSVSCIAL